MLHHRGSYLTALGNTIAFGGMPPETTKYLWTLPMFHCNGWNFPYTLAAIGGVSVCLRKVEGPAIINAINTHGATHLCGAPIVVRMLIDEVKARGAGALAPAVKMMVAAAAPPEATLKAAAEAGISLTHVYGLTEVYGPASTCEWRENWNEKSLAEQATLKARQGVAYAVTEDFNILNTETLEPVPWDGETMGEVAFRGNQVMKGYYKNPKANEEAFKAGYFMTGDLGVVQSDGYIQLKDRAKDIVISGGENISTIEIEDVIFKHEAVTEAAVVARPDDKWGETPCAFVTLRDDCTSLPSEDQLIAFAREHLPGFKAPKTVVFCELPKTSTGKIQKFVLRERAQLLGSLN